MTIKCKDGSPSDQNGQCNCMNIDWTKLTEKGATEVIPPCTCAAGSHKIEAGPLYAFPSCQCDDAVNDSMDTSTFICSNTLTKGKNQNEIAKDIGIGGGVLLGIALLGWGSYYLYKRNRRGNAQRTLFGPRWTISPLRLFR